jgi:hypothetical protein
LGAGVNVLIVGSGKGSWDMRGLQLGAAIGARVTSATNDHDLHWADLVVLVKRAMLNFGRHVAKFSKPVVWDALDFWSQPAQNQADEATALALFQQHVASVRPVAVICATDAMARDCGGVYLPHHSWKGLTPTPARESVQTVAYQGGEVFLGKWRVALEQVCARRGWSFVVNPFDLREADILVSVRDGVWDGWMCRRWKSGVKHVNAIAAGRPVLMQSSAAATEIQPCGSFVESVSDIDQAFDRWAPWSARAEVVAECERRAPQYRLDHVASSYQRVLEEVVSTCSA